MGERDARVPGGRSAGQGAGVEQFEGVAELHAAMGEIDGDGIDGGAAGMDGGGEPDDCG